MEDFACREKSWWRFQLVPDIVRKMTAEDAGDLHSFLKIMVLKVSENNLWESHRFAERMRMAEPAARQTTGP